MIIGGKREQVIENIRQAAESGAFHCKVEVDDPVLTAEEGQDLLRRYLEKRATLGFRVNNRIARWAANTASKKINADTEILGLENVIGIAGGAILTSNHFNPVDNTALRMLALAAGRKKLCIASNESNFAMSGWIGYLMNYADTFPVSMRQSYIAEHFESLLWNLLKEKNFILIYPEQEMWFNYRKPRPPKRGAYYYAAKFGVPVISCFVEIRDLEELDAPSFHKVRYVLHVLPPIFPDPAKNARENSLVMCERDHLQKKAAYEAAYGKPLDYRFEPDDIAGWIPPAERKNPMISGRLQN
ncbi:MAG TPA: 1-acyl-sn-glycerol-3-phosphate acyltransferase [Bacillota bacterium]|nr:1-acyl-sn-glycerol-3-phosphate acyltransferase [Bacillota bacterium]